MQATVCSLKPYDLYSSLGLLFMRVDFAETRGALDSKKEEHCTITIASK
jgi:hypothetical protein